MVGAAALRNVAANFGGGQAMVDPAEAFGRAGQRGGRRKGGNQGSSNQRFEHR